MRMLLLALGLFARPAFAAPGSPWGPEPAPIDWGAARADWRLVIREGEPVRVEATYLLTSVDPKSSLVTLVGPDLLVTEVRGPVFASPEGLGLALDPDRRRVEQRFAGLYSPESDGTLVLPVLAATRTHVTVDAPGLDVTIDGAVDGWLAPTDQLLVTWRPHIEGEVPYESLVTQGEVASTFRGDAGGLLVDAVVRWRVVRGEAKRFTFAANGLEELEIAGEGVGKWRREGDTVIIEPKAPAKGLFSVTVKGRATLGKSQRSVPAPEPTNVLRVDRYVTMARSDEGELIPVVMPESVPLAMLPQWAKNLGDGVPLVAWHGPQPVQVLAGAFETVQGPDTVITQARYTLAAAAEGHAALRMNLRVRNERRQYLHLRPGKGWKPVVIRVGNQPVSWLSDGEGGIYVPLEKSVETVKGLLSFPVDVEWLGTDTPVWEKKGEMKLTLPSVDAPVQAATWEVHLPRGYRALRKPDTGTGRILLGDLQAKPADDESGYAAAERERQEVVSSALQNAVSAYKQNDWSTAQTWLDQAKSVDAGNEDAQSLQANLDVLEGRTQSNDLGSRRVRDLAKAKTSGLQETQKSVEKEAEYALRAGDLDAAEAKYAAALELADELQKTEQLESAEQSSKKRVAKGKLEEIQSQRKQQADLFQANNAPAQAASASMGWSGDGHAKGDAAAAYDYRTLEDNDGDAVVDDEEYYSFDGEMSEGQAGGVEGGIVGGLLSGALGGVVADGNAEDTGGTSGLGARGSGMGGGGTATGMGGLGTLGTTGSGSGTGYGYGSGSGRGGVATPDAEEEEVDEKPSPSTGAYYDEADDYDEVRVTADKATESRSAGLFGKKQAEPPPAKPAPPPMVQSKPPPAPAPVTVTVNKDMLSKVPSGRSYQSAVGSAPGVAAGGPAGGKSEAKQEASRSAAGVKYKEKQEIDFEGYDVAAAATPVMAPEPPPPPPPPPASAAPAPMEEASYYFEGAPEVLADPAPALKSDEADRGRFGPLPEDIPAPDVTALPASPERPRRLPEKRAPLVATPSPMALAMPLDGPTLTTTQALQPANTFPSFTFLYKSLPSEIR